MSGERSSRDRLDDDITTHDVENLMMPGNYQPRRHRDRAMPIRKPRLNAVEKRLR